MSAGSPAPNLFDYLFWRGDLPFSAAPFNEVDGVILSRLSYLPFERILPGDSEAPVTVAEAARLLLAEPDLESAVLQRDDIRLLTALSECPRFRSAGLSGFVSRLDADTQTQFSAVTVELDSGSRFIAFRGTDNTLVGWKEDFNMGFVFPVPAQIQAAAYLTEAGRRFPGRLLAGGHSKGGNLAVYAAAFCEESVRGRIEAVYNYDGPGFGEEMLTSREYLSVRDRIQTFVPQTSIVGMLLGHAERHTIVHSEQSGIMQHNVYSWDVLRSRFISLKTVNASSRFIDSTLKAWMKDFDPAQRERVFDTVYEILTETHASTFREIRESKLASAKSVIHALRSLDPPTRRAVTHALSMLIRSAGSELSEVIQTREPSAERQS